MPAAHAALLERLEAGPDTARACNIANTPGGVPQNAGIERGARCGDPIGKSCPPVRGERTISLRPSAETLPHPGKAFHFMPGLWVDNRGIETTDSIVIRADDTPEVFATVPRQLFVKDRAMTKISDTVELLRELVAYPTVSADTNLALIDNLAGWLESAGARVEIHHDETGHKANLFATIGPERDGGILLSGHTDVVPAVGDDWTNDPFEMVERDGKLYGRGTCDMKGFIAASVAMAPVLAHAVKERPLHFAFTYDEEVGCLGAQALADTLAARGIRPRVAIIGEPTSMRVIEGHKGCCEYTTHFEGLAGHGSEPAKGVNAVEYAVRYVSRLLELRKPLRVRAPRTSRFDPPWTTINPGALHGGVAHNVIASHASVLWEMRPVQPGDGAFVREEMRRYVHEHLLPEMQAVWPEARIVTEVVGEVDGLEPADENRARDIVMELTGCNSADLVAFGTEAGIFQKLGMDVVVCGPGSIEQAHKPDEYLALDQLDQCLAMLEGLGAKLAG